jgi:hypothetical protein
LTSISVDSTAGLVSALKGAQAGDTILLAPGVYSDLSSKNLEIKFDTPVTITSADPSHLAVITDFRLSGVQGLTFSNLEFATLDHSDTVAKKSPWAFNFDKSSDIHFDHVKIHGSLDGDVSNDARGLAILNSENVSITNSEFQQLDRALAIGQTQNITVTGNNSHDLRSDGFDFAEVSNVQLTGNTFRDFTPAAGDHPDAIQFWTSGTKTASHDILISGNVILKGDGAYTQGIFLRDQIGTLPYERVIISNNLIVGTGYNGIRIQGATDLTLTGNELVTFAGDNKTWILIQGADRVFAAENKATAISFDKSTNVSQDGNVVTTAVDDHGVAAVEHWLDAHPTSATWLDTRLPVAVVPENLVQANGLGMAPSLYGGFSGFGGSDFLFA